MTKRWRIIIETQYTEDINYQGKTLKTLKQKVPKRKERRRDKPKRRSLAGKKQVNKKEQQEAVKKENKSRGESRRGKKSEVGHETS